MKLAQIRNIILILCMFCIISLQYECTQVLKSFIPKIGQLQTGHFYIRAHNKTRRYEAARINYKENHIQNKLDVALSITYIDKYFNDKDVDFSIRPLVRQTYFVENCKANNGNIVILKGEEKPSCVVCSANKTFNQQTQQCQCSEGFVQYFDKCVEQAQFCGKQNIYLNGTCFELVKSKSLCESDKNQVFDQEAKKCVCRTGATLTEKGNCLLCSPYSTINIEKEICECFPGYKGNGKICRKARADGIRLLRTIP